MENIHRSDLNPIERARAYHNYLTHFSFTQEQAAQKLGEDRTTISNYIRLLELTPGIQKLLIDGVLSMGHARALLGVEDPVKRQELAREITERRYSVREVERKIHAWQHPHKEKFEATPEKSPQILELEKEMSRLLATRVYINTMKNKEHRGVIVIEFYNLDDFDRIRTRMSL